MDKRKASRKRGKSKARTEDVLGGGERKAAIPKKWAKYNRRLVELGQALRRQQANLAKDAREENPTFGTHLADAGTDSYDRDFALGMLSSEQDALYEIEEALDRIRSGTYGKCELTGRPIEASRLDAIPWTCFSADAERQFEREGTSKHARLGRRETVTQRGVGDAEES